MREVYVIGVGMTRFGKYPDLWVEDLGREACIAALKDAALSPKEIQAGYCGTSNTGRITGQRILKEVGITGIEITNVENACTGGSTAFRQGYIAVGCGLYDCAIILGVDKMYGSGGLIPPNLEDLEGILGRTLPGRYAMAARRHMYEFGTTLEQLALISVKNHRNGVLNPYAQFQKECSLEEVLSSRMVAEPLTLLQCCPVGDGAAALILGSKKMSKRNPKHAIRIGATTVLSGEFQTTSTDLTKGNQVIKAANMAYEQFGGGPQDIDICELHDAFTIGELIHYENLGFCPKGEGGRFIEERKSEIGGEVAVNPSGGLLSRGHPLGATGVAQFVEVVWQLRGEAGKRQVPGAKVGMTQTVGGATSEIGPASCSVNILYR